MTDFTSLSILNRLIDIDGPYPSQPRIPTPRQSPELLLDHAMSSGIITACSTSASAHKEIRRSFARGVVVDRLVRLVIDRRATRIIRPIIVEHSLFVILVLFFTEQRAHPKVVLFFRRVIIEYAGSILGIFFPSSWRGLALALAFRLDVLAGGGGWRVDRVAGSTQAQLLVDAGAGVFAGGPREEFVGGGGGGGVLLGVC